MAETAADAWVDQVREHLAPVRFREDMRARMPDSAEAERLDVPSGTPVVEIVRTAYTAGDQVVEVNEMLADSSAYIFRTDFRV